VSWSSRRPLPVLALLCALAALAVTSGVGVAAGTAQAATPSCSAFRAPLYAHPGRERMVYLSCDGQRYPTSATVDDAPHGTVTMLSSLTYSYRPDDGYLGADHFTIHAADDQGAWPDIVVDLTVSTTLNSAPNCSYGSSGVVRDGETRNVHILSCDDAEGDPAHFDALTPPAHGTLGMPVVRSASTTNTAEWPYTPAAGYTGGDSFTYRATDDFGGVSELRTATITVNAAGSDHVPSCMTFPTGIVHGPTTLAASCSDADEDPLTLTIVTPAAHGTLGIVDGPAFSYVPAPGYSGQDSFVYTASDGHGGTSSQVTKSFQVGPNHAPSCEDRSPTVAPRASAAAPATTFALPCTDADDDRLTLVLDEAPVHGQLALDFAGQKLISTPDVGYTGPDAVRFHVADGYGGSSASRQLTLSVGEAPVGGTPPAVDPPAVDPPLAAPVEPASTPPTVRPPSAAARAAALLGASGKPFDLGLGAAAQAFAAAKGVAPGAPLAVVFCPAGCTLQVDGRLALPGAAAATARALRLAHRTLTVTAARPGVLRLTLTKAQRTRLVRARRGSVVLTLKVKAGGKSHAVKRAFAVRR
jgi:hypothetical protein